MPLDLTVVRGPVRWSRRTSAALREAVELLEDHLIGLGYDNLELRIEIGTAVVQADLRLPREPISRHGEDSDLPYLIRRILGEIQEEATPARLVRGGALPRTAETDLPEGDPWTSIRADLYAIAHREVTHAVEFGELPAGWLDASDLTDDALLDCMAGSGQSQLRILARRVRGLLQARIREAEEGAENLCLDETVPNPDPSESAVQDEFYEFRVADEAPLRGEDVVGEFEPPEDRLAADEPTEIQ